MLAERDRIDIVVAGVGGQGNVLVSRLLGEMMLARGYRVTIGETYGASQRGGSVMSHLRISAESYWSPQIHHGKCHLVISLEPTEAIRVLMNYGNPNVRVLCNTRPVHAIGVISGEHRYPYLDEVKSWIEELSEDSWFLAATERALELGNPILGNIMMIGAAAGIGALPLDREGFEAAISETLSSDKLALNLKAYDLGVRMVQ